jgi:hypothetical protein
MRDIAGSLHSVRRAVAITLRLVIESRGVPLDTYGTLINETLLWHPDDNGMKQLRYYSRDYHLFSLEQMPIFLRRIVYEMLAPVDHCWLELLGSRRGDYVRWDSI